MGGYHPRTREDAWQELMAKQEHMKLEESPTWQLLQASSRWTLRQIDALAAFLETLSESSDSPLTSSAQQSLKPSSLEERINKVFESEVASSYQVGSVGHLLKSVGFVFVPPRLVAEGYEAFSYVMELRVELDCFVKNIYLENNGERRFQNTVRVTFEDPVKDLKRLVMPHRFFYFRDEKGDAFKQVLDILDISVRTPKNDIMRGAK